MKTVNSFLLNDFIFSPRYKVWRHVIYWAFHIAVWAALWKLMGVPLSYARHVLNMCMWVPCFIFFSYPLVYFAIPHYLLTGKLLQFFFIVLCWGASGIYIDIAYRSYILIPLQEALKLDNILPRGPLAFCYLCMTTSAASPMLINFFKLWIQKQQEWLQVSKEKANAELELLKKQIHPHFLFNTLNNIYSFSLDQSPKTPELILKLSSLLSYMLYDCRTEKVRLEKEIEIMKNYIDLEKERYGSTFDISWSDDTKSCNGCFIAPLLMLPFLENAFKHGPSEQLNHSWLSVDISVKHQTLLFKIANSKNEFVTYREGGIGVANVKKRLELIYAGDYELKINDEGNFFVVTLLIKMKQATVQENVISFLQQPQTATA